MNPIENVFAELSRRLDEMYQNPAKANVDKPEFVEDVNACLQDMQNEGLLARICCDERMRKKFTQVLEADGGATPG